MIYEYPCLKDFVKDDPAIIDCFATIFDTIRTASTVIFQSFDNELLTEMGYTFYFVKATLPLTTLYFFYCKNTVDWTDDLSIKAFFAHLAKVAYARFGANWEKIYAAYFTAQYNPLENYDMEQQRTPYLKYQTSTKRTQDTKTETSGKTKIVPFNATTSTLTGETEGDSETTEENTDNQIDSSSSETGNEKLTRHGNIGVTTSQQMLEAEINVRNLDFQKRIFTDIGKIFFRNFFPSDKPFLL